MNGTRVLVVLHTKLVQYIHMYIRYVHTYIHMYIRYVHTYIHTYVHTYIHTFVHTYVHAYVLSQETIKYCIQVGFNFESPDQYMPRLVCPPSAHTMRTIALHAIQVKVKPTHIHTKYRVLENCCRKCHSTRGLNSEL